MLAIQGLGTAQSDLLCLHEVHLYSDVLSIFLAITVGIIIPFSYYKLHPMGVMATLAILKLLEWHQLPTLSQYHHRSDMVLYVHGRPPVSRLGKANPHHHPPGTKPYSANGEA